MCGIAGIVDWASASLPDDSERVQQTFARLREMIPPLKRRGPDGEGVLRIGPCFLAHARLSVIDPEGGAQPMRSADGRFAAVTNGEIYNHRELRAELESGGAPMRTRSDTEVLVEGYARHGVAWVRRLNGMFAFAVWDSAQQRLSLARDRLGKKPLFVCERREGFDPGHVVFSSSLRSLLASGLVPRKLDTKAIDGYVRWNHFAPNATPIAEVKRVEPATHLVFWRFAETPLLPPPRDANPGYWTLRYVPEKRTAYPDAVGAVKTLLDDSVRLRFTESDVPVGIFLSSGVDSAAIAASAAAQGLKPRTFTIGFDDPNFDESADAEILAKHLGTDHTTLRVGIGEGALSEAVAGVVGALDEPLSDASAIPTWLLAREARKHVTVALTGDGGDEVFLGYDAYRGARLARKLNRVPGVARTVAMRLLSLMAVTEKHRGFVGRARRFVDALGMDALVRHLHWKGAVEGHRRWAALRADPSRTKASDYYPTMYEERVLAGIGSRDLLRRLQAVDFEAYLAQDVLIKVDRMSMDHGLEVRSPMLDYRLVELAWSLPVDYLLRGRVQKRALRDVTAPRVPAGWMDRPKRGFGVPLRAWLAGPLAGWVRERCSPEALERLPMLNPAVVAQWVESLASPKSAAAADVWCVAILSAWAESIGL